VVTRLAQDRESSPAETSVLTTMYAANSKGLINMLRWDEKSHPNVGRGNIVVSNKNRFELIKVKV